MPRKKITPKPKVKEPKPIPEVPRMDDLMFFRLQELTKDDHFITSLGTVVSNIRKNFWGTKVLIPLDGMYEHHVDAIIWLIKRHGYVVKKEFGEGGKRLLRLEDVEKPEVYYQPHFTQ